VRRGQRVSVRPHRGAPVGRDRPVVVRPGQYGRDSRAGKQCRAPDKNLERHDVHGGAQVPARGAGHVVQQERAGARWRRRGAPVPVVGPADGGKLFRVAERQGHRVRSSGPAVVAGRGPSLRSGTGGGGGGPRQRPRGLRPETVRGGRGGRRRHSAVRGRAGRLVHDPERVQRYRHRLEDADRGRGRRGP